MHPCSLSLLLHSKVSRPFSGEACLTPRPQAKAWFVCVQEKAGSNQAARDGPVEDRFAREKEL
jgi:hypothetical protein